MSFLPAPAIAAFIYVDVIPGNNCGNEEQNESLEHDCGPKAPTSRLSFTLASLCIIQTVFNAPYDLGSLSLTAAPHPPMMAAAHAALVEKPRQSTMY